MGGLPVADEASLLVEFLRDLEGVLEDVADTPSGLVPAELEGLVQRAWPHVQPRFATARDAIEAAAGSGAFEAAGLFGDQLLFKLRGFELARGRFIRVRAARTLASALGWANVILKSLPIAVTVKEPIEEYKSAVERAAQDVAEEPDSGGR
jgi:hypothetical protein